MLLRSVGLSDCTAGGSLDERRSDQLPGEFPLVPAADELQHQPDGGPGQPGRVLREGSQPDIGQRGVLDAVESQDGQMKRETC